MGGGTCAEASAREDDGQESSSLLWPGRNVWEAERSGKVVKAAFYAAQVFYSFFIM